MPISSAEIMKTIDEREMQKTTKEKLYESKHVAVECRCLKIWELLQRCIKKKKERKKNTWRYHYFTPVYQKSKWYHLQFLRYRTWQTEIGNFKYFFAFLPPYKRKKSKFQKNKKNEQTKKKCCWYHHFIHVYQKSESYDVRFLRTRSETDRIFCLFGPFFALLPHQQSAKLKFKKMKKTPRDIIGLH